MFTEPGYIIPPSFGSEHPSKILPSVQVKHSCPWAHDTKFFLFVACSPWWLSLCKDVEEHVNVCTVCAHTKYPTQAVAGPLFPIPVPSCHTAIDLITSAEAFTPILFHEIFRLIFLVQMFPLMAYHLQTEGTNQSLWQFLQAFHLVACLP